MASPSIVGNGPPSRSPSSTATGVWFSRPRTPKLWPSVPILVAFGGAHRWTINRNWKLPAEQFASDFYRAHITHRSAMAALAPPGTPSELLVFPDEGFQFSLAQGHGTGFAATELPLVEAARRADPAEVARVAAASERLGERRGESMGAQHMTVFPNLSLLKDPRALRVWHPRGPHSIEVWSWTLVEADDGENWVEIQGVLRGAKARESDFNVGMGLERERPANPDLPGEIDAFVIGSISSPTI